MTKETLYDLLNDVDERYIEAAHAPTKQKEHGWGKRVAAAACLCLLLAGAWAIRQNQTGFFPIGTLPTALPTVSPTSPPSVSPTAPPQAIQPLYNHFDSPGELLALYHATEGTEDEYLSYFESLNIYSDITHFLSTQEGGKEFIAWLRSMPLPCRKDAEETFGSLYYYTQGKVKGFELFYDIDGIRYKLHCMDAQFAPSLDGESVATVSIGEYSFDLHEMDYGSSRRLFGNCYVGDYVLCIWVNTMDSQQVDFSGFYLGDLIESFS